MSEELRKAAEQAALAIFPAMPYGLPGTKDTQQKALQLAYAALINALAEPEQPDDKPLAWMFEYPDKRVAPKFDIAPHGGNWKPLFAAPPRREPLSDEQVADIWDYYCNLMGEASINEGYNIARAIEAAHGITGVNNAK